MFCNHNENQLCSLNALKYIIFIPDITSNDLGKSSHQVLKKYHVVQEEFSLIMHNLTCLFAYAHTQHKWCSYPYYLLFNRCRLMEIQMTLAMVWTSAFRNTIWQVLLIPRLLEFQSSLSLFFRLFLLVVVQFNNSFDPMFYLQVQ